MLVLSKSCSVQSNIQQTSKHYLVLLLYSGLVTAGTVEGVACLNILSGKGTLLGLVCDETAFRMPEYDQTKIWVNQQLILLKKLKSSSAISEKLTDQVTFREDTCISYVQVISTVPSMEKIIGQKPAVYSFWKK